MLAHSTRDRSRSPIKPTDESTSNPTEPTSNNKAKKEGESQQRMRNLKSFIQTLINESTSLGSTYDEQVKALEKACAEEYHDITSDRIRRMIKSFLKVQNSQINTTNSFVHQDHSNLLSTTNEHTKKNRSNSIPNIPSTKPPDLVTSSTSNLAAFDADFLRHAFSQQFRPTLDLSAYFSTANGTNTTSSLFRPNFSPSNFLQSLTNTPATPSLVSLHTNGTNDSSMSKSSKQGKLSTPEMSSIRVLVNAYREAASYLCRSADELEQLI